MNEWTSTPEHLQTTYPIPTKRPAGEVVGFLLSSLGRLRLKSSPSCSQQSGRMRAEQDGPIRRYSPPNGHMEVAFSIVILFNMSIACMTSEQVSSPRKRDNSLFRLGHFLTKVRPLHHTVCFNFKIIQIGDQIYQNGRAAAFLGGSFIPEVSFGFMLFPFVFPLNRVAGSRSLSPLL